MRKILTVLTALTLMGLVAGLPAVRGQFGGCPNGRCGVYNAAPYYGTATYGVAPYQAAPALPVVQPVPAAPVTQVTEQPATLQVILPEAARLKIDDYQTVSTGSSRQFHTPALPLGQDYQYTLTATYEADGHPEVITRKVTVRGGQQTVVDFNAVATTRAR